MFDEDQFSLSIPRLLSLEANPLTHSPKTTLAIDQSSQSLSTDAVDCTLTTLPTDQSSERSFTQCHHGDLMSCFEIAGTVRQALYSLMTDCSPNDLLTTDHSPNIHIVLSKYSPHSRRFVGLVVKASASRAEDPGFESRLRRDFWGGRVTPVT